VSIPAGALLIAFASRTEARVSAVIFAVSLTALYGTSALYHRRPWSERAARKMKHLDHSMIFVLIAGSYTPLTLLALRPAWGITLLALAWTGAVAGVTITLFRLDQLHRLGMVMYLGLGWLLVVALPQIFHVLTGPELVLLAAGGLLYSVGAVVLATNWPNPSPRVFGYHEIWHVMVVAAGACHFAMIALLVH
jgi:hemolysin III